MPLAPGSCAPADTVRTLPGYRHRTATTMRHCAGRRLTGKDQPRARAASPSLSLEDTPPKGARPSGGQRFGKWWRSGSDPFGVAQRVTAAPYGLDVILAVCGLDELLAQLADEHVDDLQLGLVHPTVEMIEHHFLGQRCPLAEA